jgi:hypothetical protein
VRGRAAAQPIRLGVPAHRLVQLAAEGKGVVDHGAAEIRKGQGHRVQPCPWSVVCHALIRGQELMDERHGAGRCHDGYAQSGPDPEECPAEQGAGGDPYGLHRARVRHADGPGFGLSLDASSEIHDEFRRLGRSTPPYTFEPRTGDLP